MESASHQADPLGRAKEHLAAGKTARALEIMRQAAAHQPDNPLLQNGLGVALRFNGRLDEAAHAFSRALELEPGMPGARVFLGMIRLAQGRQREGWRLYRARWRFSGWLETMRYPAENVWQGQANPGLRLLLWSEQGFGDTIQFARYAPWLRQLLHGLGGELALEAHEPLCGLFRANWPEMEIFSRGQAKGRFNAHLPLMDLPCCWDHQVGIGGLPFLPLGLPYLRAGNSPAATGFRGGARPLRVGIVWQGRTSHPDDRWRSIASFNMLEPLFAVPGIRWVSLQKGACGLPGWLLDGVADCNDFADTARVAAGLDLVISIDSAVAHLAGALGRPVWLLLPPIPDWRWLTCGDSTPWYPTMRLFRQQAGEGWRPVLERAATELAGLSSLG